MSSAVGFLVVAAAAAIVGSLVLWLWHRARTTAPPTFSDHLSVLAPRDGSPKVDQPTGIVPFDPDSGEELNSGT